MSVGTDTYCIRTKHSCRQCSGQADQGFRKTSFILHYVAIIGKFLFAIKIIAERGLLFKIKQFYRGWLVV